MKKKSFTILATLALSTAFGAGAYAGANLEEIQAYLNRGLQFKIDGAAWQPKDTNGSPLYPITYNGTTYLPVRAISNALQVAVNYDETTNTVLLGERSEGVPITAEKFSPLIFVLTKETSKTEYKGTNHKEVFHTSAINGSPSVKFYPEKKYQKLFLQVAAEGNPFTVKVESNDVELAAKKIAESDGIQTIEVDIGGVKELKVKIDAAPLAEGEARIFTSSYYK